MIFKNFLKNMLLQKGGRLLSQRWRGAASILTYHRIAHVAEDNLMPNAAISVAPDAFNRQMELLSQECSCISLPEAIIALQKGFMPPDAMVVTFDDGYRDNILNALPVLESFDVPATIYITTGFIDGTEYPWWYEQEVLLSKLSKLSFKFGNSQFSFMLASAEQKISAAAELNLLFKRLGVQDRKAARDAMLEAAGEFQRENLFLSWDEIRELDKNPLITIGAHTVSHQSLAHITDEELRREIYESKCVLERELHRPVQHFSYPYGFSDNAGMRESQAAAEAGFASAVTSRFGHVHRADKDHLYMLPRIHIDHYDSMLDFRWKISGFAARNSTGLRE